MRDDGWGMNEEWIYTDEQEETGSRDIRLSSTRLGCLF